METIITIVVILVAYTVLYRTIIIPIQYKEQRELINECLKTHKDLLALNAEQELYINKLIGRPIRHDTMRRLDKRGMLEEVEKQVTEYERLRELYKLD